MDNLDEPLTREEQIANLEALLQVLYDLCEFGAPHARGECMECERDGTALWLYGDFVLCHRCVARRRAPRAA